MHRSRHFTMSEMLANLEAAKQEDVKSKIQNSPAYFKFGGEQFGSKQNFLCSYFWLNDL